MSTTRRRIAFAAAIMIWPLVWLIIRFTLRVRILIIVDNEILLVKNLFGVNVWTLPGGGIKRGEDPLTAARRELKEEVSLDAPTNKFKHLGVFRQTKAHRFKFHGYALELAKKPKIWPATHEIAKAEWFKISDLKTMNVRQHVGLLVDAWRKQR